MNSCFDFMLIALRFAQSHNNTYQPSGFQRKKLFLTEKART